MPRSEQERPLSEGRGSDPLAVLREGCDRNAPVCVVRPTQMGRVPMARGRLLSLHEDRIEIEEVRVPGRDIRFSEGEDLDAYFSVGHNLYQFRTRLLRVRELTRLNEQKTIRGMWISRPVRIESGDRRRLFRVVVSGLHERITAEVWRLRDESADEDRRGEGSGGDGAGMPSFAFNIEGLDLSSVVADREREADFSGWVADGTESGLALRLEFVRPYRFALFEPMLVRLRLPSGRGVLRFLCEVRGKRSVGDDGTRLGLVIIPEADRRAHASKTGRLRSFLTDVQRAQLRRKRAG